MSVHPLPLHLSIAGVSLAAHSPDPDLKIELLKREERFVVSPGPAALHVDVLLVRELPPRPEVAPLFDTGEVWTLYPADYGYTLFAGARGNKRMVRLNHDMTLVEVWCPTETVSAQGTVQALGHPVLEMLTYWRLVAEGGLGVHASAVLLDGKGYLFSGHSGAGKSTIGELWAARGATILNDDRIGLRPGPEGVTLYGTPWHGTAEYATPTSAPLAGIYFIHHAPQNELIEMTASESAGQLLGYTFFPFFDGGQIARAQETATAIAAAVPCRRLGFVPEGSVVDFVLEG